MLTYKLFQGTAINFSNLSGSVLYPLAYGGDVAAELTPRSEARCYIHQIQYFSLISCVTMANQT